MANDSSLQITTPTDQEIVISRRFSASQEKVFRALTEPDLIQRWMTGPEGWTLETCECDLQPGGSLRYVWKHEDGRMMGLSGTYKEISPPEKLIHTELFDGDWTGGETLVTNSLKEDGDQTKLTISVLYNTQDARDAALKSGMDSGMEHSYNELASVLDSLD